MNFLDLPPELITSCLLSVCGRDLSSVSQACSALRDICSIDRLWQNRCLKEFGFTSKEGWNATFREIYAKILYKYGYCIGLWRETSSCYGGLIYAQYEPGCIVGRGFYSLKDVREPLKSQPLFKIILKDGKAEMLCLKGYREPHPCTMLGGGSDEAGPGQMFVHCSGKDLHRHTEGQEKERQLFFEDAVKRGTHEDLIRIKWDSHRKLEPLLKLEQLHPPVLPATASVPIQPGFFKGMYGGHGTEIVLLSYDLEKNVAEARKITGDPNVPSGEISICADLSRPMVLTSEQQCSVAMLADIDTFDLPPETEPDKIVKQPFVIPSGVFIEDSFTLPKYCISRYHSQGTVSPMGYLRPEKIVNHFIVFDKDTFGVLWLGLYSFGLFSRVHEEFHTR